MLRLSAETESVETISLETESTEIGSTEPECAGNESAVSNLIESAVSEYVCAKIAFSHFSI